jgi:hypothetical protein
MLTDRPFRRLERHASPSTVAGLVGGALAVVCLVPLFPSLPAVTAAPVGPVPRYFSSPAYAGVAQGTPMVVYPMASVDQMGAVVWQFRTGPRFQMPGGTIRVPLGPAHLIAWDPTLGYTVDTPLTRALVELYRGTPEPMTPAARRVLRAQIRAWHLAMIVAFPQGVTPDRVVPWFTWLTGRAPVEESGAEVWPRLQHDVAPRR